MDNQKIVTVTLKPGKEKPVRMGHPWIFSGAVAQISDNASSGDLCIVLTSTGEKLGTGYYNHLSAICVRMLTKGKLQFTNNLLEDRIKQSIQRRESVIDSSTNSCRLINSEGDFLPGLIVDKLDNGLVIQILTSGMERFRVEIIKSLVACCLPQFIYDRSDTESRKREGLKECNGLLFGTAPERTIIIENGLSFFVDVSSGQKTGYFFDQRYNRKLLRSFSKGKNVCDCFSYSGAFSVNALAAGAAHVDVVDISKSAIGWARENIKQSCTSEVSVDFFNVDVFKYLRETPKMYDLIVLDPPKFAKHTGEVNRAARGYKDINLIALKKLNTEGILFTFSCSQAVDMRLFRQIVFAAASDSGRNVQLLHVLTAGPDHPVNMAHIEGEYLKGLILRVI